MLFSLLLILSYKFFSLIHYFDVAPTGIQNLTLEYNGTHILATWDEPLEPNGNLNYSVDVIGTSLVTLEEVIRESFVIIELGFSLEASPEAYVRYTVFVVPQTGGGQGPGMNITTITPERSK